MVTGALKSKVDAVWEVFCTTASRTPSSTLVTYSKIHSPVSPPRARRPCSPGLSSAV